MRYTILIILCTISLTASAQWWKIGKKNVRYPLLTEVQNPKLSLTTAQFKMPEIGIVTIQPSVYSIELAENVLLKEAKHNMRFRIYNIASYNFSDLAALYIQQNRFSEAKWYLLQSNAISMEENDDKHTITNLLALAGIKIQIGELTLAMADLQAAHDLARSKGMQAELTEADKRIHSLQFNKSPSVKAELRYAEAAEIPGKS
jgi:hypothetical protein